jgi:hypothetical protein
LAFHQRARYFSGCTLGYPFTKNWELNNLGWGLGFGDFRVHIADGYFIHGDHRNSPYTAFFSAGCIDIASNDNAFYNFFKDYNGFVPLYVKY